MLTLQIADENADAARAALTAAEVPFTEVGVAPSPAPDIINLSTDGKIRIENGELVVGTGRILVKSPGETGACIVINEGLWSNGIAESEGGKCLKAFAEVPA